MSEGDETDRTIATCQECGALYAALEITDGTYRPIGQRDGCKCGCTEFTPVDDSFPDLSLEEESSD